MGQKIHPVGFRVGVIRGFDSQWYYGKKGYGVALLQDDRIRRFIKRRTGLGNVSRVELERAANRVKVTIFTARPGAIIGRGGKGIDELTDTLNRPGAVGRQDRWSFRSTSPKIRQPELDAQLVAENVCQQLEKRISHRRAMRQAMTRVMRMNGRGIKIQVFPDGWAARGNRAARGRQDRKGSAPHSPSRHRLRHSHRAHRLR